MKTVLFILSVFLLRITAFSQNIEIKGRIIDAETNNPVEFANIGVVGVYAGTASDFNGNFNLEISKDFIGSDVIISAVGYRSKEISIIEMQEYEGRVIKLFPHTYGIEQVEVTADSKRLYGILKTASTVLGAY